MRETLLWESYCINMEHDTEEEPGVDGTVWEEGSVRDATVWEGGTWRDTTVWEKSLEGMPKYEKKKSLEGKKKKSLEGK